MTTNTAGGPYNDDLQKHAIEAGIPEAPKALMDAITVPENAQEYYYGTKRVAAWEAPGPNGERGFAVLYADGYQSWSPYDVFIEAYHPTTSMLAGHALYAVQHQGAKAARKGWNGAGMFIYFVPPGVYPARTAAAQSFYGESGVPYRGYLALKATDDTVVPWVASQSDLLADDWYIVE